MQHPTTSSPALPPIAVDDLAGLSAKQTTILDRLVAEHGEENRTGLLGFLRGFGWDEEVVDEKLEALQRYVDAYPASKLDVLPFLGMDPERPDKPRACAVLLEDGRGGVARDVRGNPVTVTFGMPEQVDAARGIRVSLFMLERMRQMKYYGPRQAPNMTAVVDLAVRKDLDKFEYSMNLTMLEFMNNFPNTGMTYICGASQSIVNTITRFVRNSPFASYLENVVFDTGYGCLDGVIPYEHMLPWWHEKASFDFSIDKYKAYLLADADGADGYASE